MQLRVFSQNGQILPIDRAITSITEIERMYGFGVYETLKVRNDVLYFLEQHIDRLFHSANCIDLQHHFSPETVCHYVQDLTHAVGAESFNIKLLLLGQQEKTAQLLIFPLAPFFAKKEWYRDGVSVFSYEHERWMPQAKTLNMLPSYYYFTKAREKGGHDALFIDRSGNIREGTRANVYVMKGTQIFSPPKEDVLEGVTMMSLEKVIAASQFRVQHTKIPIGSLSEYDGMFLTSTSAKIMPVKTVDDFSFHAISSALHELVDTYSAALKRSEGQLDKLSPS